MVEGGGGMCECVCHLCERLDELRVRFQQRPRSRTVVLLTHAKMDSMRVLL